ncbi:MAG TPA: twin transmembrane helix small protein [Steroidobacteraceae bacterium]|jgi:cytochrome bd-type quinol oxidase subunit 2|nr:twin transmembrane helix small protein [Steroidobacteraceae bacterium]
MDIIRILIFVVLIAIVASLGSALFHLSSSKSDADNSRKMARALTVRIVLSLALFFLIMLAWWFGLITPHNYHR